MTSRDEGVRTYREFASRITFFSFLDIEEFNPTEFKAERYREELDALEELHDVNVGTLSRFLKEHPRSISIFSRLLREQRFSNTQIAHFCFDIGVINSSDIDTLVAVFEAHHAHDPLFATHVEKEMAKLGKDGIIERSDASALSDEEKVILLKATVQLFSGKDEYLISLLRNPEFPKVSERTARYLIENLWVERFLEAMDVEKYLLAKRRARDTKGLHGNFGSQQVRGIIERRGIPCLDEILKGNSTLPLETVHPDLRSTLDWEAIRSGWSYTSEKFIEGVVKPKENKAKQFDFLLLHEGVPKVAVETNFYTTVGTKIGINIGEYTDLLDDIEERGLPLHFIWITDGPTWLQTSMRRQMVDQLIPKFGNHLMNYQLFDEYLRTL